MLLPHVNDNLRAYGLVTPAHAGIEQEFERLCGTIAPVQFTPHLIPMTRGILMTGYATLRGDADTAGLLGDTRRSTATRRSQVLPEGSPRDQVRAWLQPVPLAWWTPARGAWWWFRPSTT